VHTDDVRQILADPSRSRPVRLLRLQGLRGERLTQAVAAGWSIRIGPAACAAIGAVALIAASPLLYGIAAGLAGLGAVLPNHSIELAYVAWARRTGRTAPPPNRAGRRFGCLVASICFLLAGWGLSHDVAVLFWTFGSVMVAMPAFVAATNLCVPSLVFTAMFGTERATCPTLATAWSRTPATDEVA
jgi:Domain of unknown function (DUF4395)